MCGRYAVVRSIDEIRRIFTTSNPPPNWAGSWNIAPTQSAPVVRTHPKCGERHLDLLQWGLLPHWARDPGAVRHPFNARAEGAASAPMFRDSVKHRRAIVPADHFYEWQVHEGAKAPHAIARADGRMLAFAGLWEYWRQPEGGLLRTFTILTTAANDVLRPVHDRMPVVLEEADWPLWLGEVDGDVMSLANRSVAEFRVWPVSTAVNNVRNDSPDLAAALV